MRPAPRAGGAGWIAAWLAGAACATVWVAAHAGIAQADGGWIPVSYDSFYHARRILDAAADPGAFREFDPTIHAPEGSAITWPWAYDWTVAMLLRGVLALAPMQLDPMALLAWLPVVLLGVNLALLLLACRALGLGPGAGAFAAIAYAASPLALFMHAPGNIDHHHAEQACVLLALLATLRWLAQPGSAARAAVLGGVLALAHGVHNGLFVLQLPVLFALAVLWLRGRMPPPRACAAFGLTLVGVLVLVLAPSRAFRAGESAFYLLSWFHLYAAGATALAVAAMARWRATIATIAALVLLGAALLVLQLASLDRGLMFVSGEIPYLTNIVEAYSFGEMLAQRGLRGFLQTHSWLPFALPLMLLGCWTLRRREGAAPALLGSLLLGFVMYSQQMRLFYYALPAMLLALAACAHALVARIDVRDGVRGAMFVALAALAAAPSLPLLSTRLPLGGDYLYEVVRPVVVDLGRACEAQPGIVLANRNIGHFLTFHTRCSVIANNFIMTQQHVDKIDESYRLLALPPAELLRAQPPIRYLLLEAPAWAIESLQRGEAIDPSRETRALYRELLLRDAPQPGFVPIGERVARHPGGARLALVKMWRLQR